MRTKGTLIILALALTAGAAIGYVDSRPTWDDTGITAGFIFLASAILARMRPRAAWLVGLAVGTPVLTFNLVLHGNLASAVAVAIGLAGAGVGYLIGKTAGSGEAPRSL
jgi:hypothetical protein